MKTITMSELTKYTFRHEILIFCEVDYILDFNPNSMKVAFRLFVFHPNML